MGCAKSFQPSKDNQDISGEIYVEIMSVKETLELVKKDKEKIWAQGDMEFYGLWLRGLQEEKKKRFAEAIEFYESAYKVTRYEMSSYEVLLPLGRAYILNGEKAKAASVLNEFLRQAESELSSFRPWELSDEGEDALRRDLVNAKRLIDLCK
jgi:hypothetical protein